MPAKALYLTNVRYRSSYWILARDSDPLNSASNAYMVCCCVGREIPSFFILAINVVRFTPSLAAAPVAPPTTHPTASRVCKIRARSESFNVLAKPVTASAPAGGSGFGSTPSFDRITARSMRF